MAVKDLADTLAWHLEHIGKLEKPVREFRFHPKRRWRFDLAWPTKKIAVEVHGGEWSGGRHVRGYGLKGDCEKQRAASRLGWKVFPFTGSEVNDGIRAIIDEIREVLDENADL